jgi:hypothetical protein
MIEIFRSELIEAEKSRLDLFKWKLIISAALAGIGLGFVPDNQVYPKSIFSSMHLVLCIIPLACNYVDLLCVNLQIRILMIGKFFKEIKDEDIEGISLIKTYETFCEDNSHVFSLDDIAQFWSTYFVSILVFAVGLYHLSIEPSTFLLLSGSGIIGIFLTFIIFKKYCKLCAKIKYMHYT